MAKHSTKGPDEGSRRTNRLSLREAVAEYAAERGERPRRKNYFLRQSKIDLAKRILEAETETEAVDRALDLVIYGEALALGTESMAGEEYHDVLGISDEVSGR